MSPRARDLLTRRSVARRALQVAAGATAPDVTWWDAFESALDARLAREGEITLFSLSTAHADARSEARRSSPASAFELERAAARLHRAAAVVVLQQDGQMTREMLIERVITELTLVSVRSVHREIAAAIDALVKVSDENPSAAPITFVRDGGADLAPGPGADQVIRDDIAFFRGGQT